MSIESDVHDQIGQLQRAPGKSANFSAQAIPIVLPLIDVFIISLCSLAGAIVYPLELSRPMPDLTPQLAVGLLAGLLYVLGISRGKFYHYLEIAARRVEVRDILVHWTTTALVLALVAFLLKIGGAFSRATFIIFYLITPVALLVARKFAKTVIAEAVSSGRIGRRDTVLLGEFSEMLALTPQDLLAACGATEVSRFVLSQENDPDARRTADMHTISLLADFVRRHNCGQILLALPWSSPARIEFIRDRIKALPVAARLLPDTRVRSLANVACSSDNRTLALEVQRAPLSGVQRSFKRVADLLGASLALIFFMPVMILTAVAIKLDSPGPVIFRQNRKGFNGRQFVIFKFRTMTVQENGATVVQATQDDSRVTRLGQLLRSSSIDELPQLVNVLRGDMSLVGPRPHALAHDDYFESVVGDYAHRHHVKPGITGWAQCNGARGATPSVEHISERVKFDLWYVNNWSFWLDIQILIKTVFEVLRKTNAY